MPSCTFAEGGAMFGATPVDNMFILEYMPCAPGEFVRVYLYGLMQCCHPELGEDVDGIARALRVEREAVMNAFKYWEREGLVTQISENPPAYQYLPLMRQALQREPLDEVYKYRNFNQSLQQLLPGTVLDAHEIRIANEWLDELKMPEDLALYMVRAEVKRRGGKLPAPRTLFKHLNDMAMDWVSQKISTVEDAERYIKRESAAMKCAQAVLRQFGQKRAATLDEIALADKWTGEWHLSDKDVLNGCAETVKSANPSFAYLDKILQSRLNGVEGERTRDILKTLINHLGVSTKPTPSQAESYQSFRDMGFGDDVIEEAAKWCGENNRRTFEDIARKLEQWKAMDVFTLAEIEEERRVQKQFTDIALLIFERAGIDRKVTKSDLGQVKIWTALMELDSVLFAAECARGAEAPMKYINKLVSVWSASGIRTLEAAKQAFVSLKPQAADARAKAAGDYQQRDIKPSDFEKDFFVDVMNRKKADNA